MTLLYFSIFWIIIISIGFLAASIHIKILRRKGIYPKQGEATIEDVRKLINIGRETMALGVYRELYGVGLKVAKKEIKKIKKKEL